MVMEFKHLIYEKEEGIARITLNRPKALNALNAELIAELDGLLDTLAKDGAVRMVLLTGAGDKAFVAGADISELAHMDSFSARIFAEAGQGMMAKIANLPMPVMAVVNGFALGGGCELALACDFIYASDKAQFGLPEETLGLIPGFGGTQRLARRVGAAMAMELIFTAKRIGAEEARQLGLVNRVFPAEELMDAAMKTAKTIASMGPAAIALAKISVHRGVDVDLNAGCHMEKEAFGLCFASPDAKEGTGAFLEKRKAVFSTSR
jgi:enoyl-CoA hydratase